jgi:hypothetical protein
MAKIIPRIFRIMDTSAVTARTLQGMARVRSGQAPAWPLVSDRSVRRGSRVKRDFACTFTWHFSPALVVLRSQSRLMLEGRTRILSGPSPDLSPASSCTFRLHADRPISPGLHYQLGKRTDSGEVTALPPACRMPLAQCRQTELSARGLGRARYGPFGIHCELLTLSE